MIDINRIKNAKFDQKIMAQHNDLGRRGEDLAAEHLLSNGFSILERNWRSGNDEVDIIASIQDLLIFAEVKTRSTKFFGEPQVWVGKKKQDLIIRSAEKYIQQTDVDKEVRFDILAVVINKKEGTVHHIENAFIPRW